MTTTYVKRPGTIKNGKINIDIGRFRSVNVKVRAISETIIKTISMAKIV